MTLTAVPSPTFATDVMGNVGGVDTHKATHYAALVDARGHLLAHQEFPANERGYHAMLDWFLEHGPLEAVGVESTGSFGASLARFLTGKKVHVVEANSLNVTVRRRDGKSDRLDAEQVARAVLSQASTAIPKSKNGAVEVIRALRVTRTSAVKAKTQTFNTLWGLIIGSPSVLRDELTALSKRTLIKRCLALRPETTDLLSLASSPDRLLLAGTKTALRDLARRWRSLDEEIAALNRQIDGLVRQAAPELVALHGVGAEVAGQFLVTVGDNNNRIHSEAAFAKLCGVAPQPASSGRTTGRHRLSRGGDRAANSALYIVALVRMRRHQPTIDYVQRRTAEGLSKREIIRCLKRYIAREIYANLPRQASEPPSPVPLTTAA